ncbi:hypothetical protein DDE18_16480 [Nocardioides gansuensis]|uniref:YoaR-like putative peptidoglycan binding domain-containing protein n=1 Tax=Nocardioides gansuensis TaxID=2138300 RepID=A0A2T8F7B2_9ACTN|nr:VanW family protein [Nocardioides gansuensis]PVG81600.1 hypothetical protein DDE18_16480 [Nocardioides gansuensis]
MSILPPNTKAPAQEKSGGGVVVGLLLGLGVLFGGAYVAAHEIAGDKVPRGTTVSGVSIGGHPQAEAADALREGLAERVSGPIPVKVDGRQATVDPAAAGITVDYEASVAEAGGEDSWHPIRLWHYFTGGEQLEAVVTVDETAFNAAVAALDAAHGKPATDGAVTFAGSRVQVTDPQVGRELDPSDTQDALLAAYLDEGGAPAELELTQAQPEIDEGDVAEALKDFANPAVADPVRISFKGETIKLFPADYTPALSLQPVNGELVPDLDEKRLAELLEDKVTAGAPVDATVQLVDGRPKVIPAKPGVTFDQDQVDAAFLDLVARPLPERSLEVESRVAHPEFTTREARELGITEKVSTFTTYFPYADYRNVNIGRAAELVNGTVLKPGETFSLNETVGERTEANGFTEGFIISDGIFKEDLGGGVSQMATTTFNAMFFAGLKDIEHKPHSFYIDRYPVGREATVAWGAVDLQFQNDTPYGVLIQAGVTPSTPSSSGVVTVSMWSTKHWEITTSTSDRYNLTEPETRTLRTKDCYPNEGYGGFEVDVTRYFEPVPPNTEQREPETFHTTYTPSDTVICKEPRTSGDGEQQ